MELANTVENDQRFVLKNHLDIIRTLNELAQQKTILNLSFNHGRESCLTTVIEVDTKANEVYLDVGLDEAFNKRLFASRRVLFTKDSGLRIRWVSESLAEVTLHDGKAIKIALPHEITRIQRREYFRVPTKIIDAVPCHLAIPQEVETDEKKYMELFLVDASIGGVGLLAPDPLDPMLVRGMSFEGAKIFFPDVGTTSLTLRVQSIYPVTMEDGTNRHHVGMQFIDPSRANQSLIYRFMTILEREAMAIRKNAD